MVPSNTRIGVARNCASEEVRAPAVPLAPGREYLIYALGVINSPSRRDGPVRTVVEEAEPRGSPLIQ